MARRPTNNYPLWIYMRNKGTSLEITGDNGIITIESRAMLNAVPPNIDNWGCKYRRMSDGRCFVVMRTFIPSSFLVDMLCSMDNIEAKAQLFDYFATEMRRVRLERENEN